MAIQLKMIINFSDLFRIAFDTQNKTHNLTKTVCNLADFQNELDEGLKKVNGFFDSTDNFKAIVSLFLQNQRLSYDSKKILV